MMQPVRGTFIFLLLMIALALNLGGCSGAKNTKLPREGAGQAITKAPCETAPEKKDLGRDYSDIFRDRPYPHGKPLPDSISDPRIVVHKERRSLRLYSGPRLMREYSVKLGHDPVNDKEIEGDGRTPLGKFYVCMKNPQSRYHLSLGLSYPNLEDAERGLRGGLISRTQYDDIVQRLSQGEIPLWNTRLGGEIFIHGAAESWDWTYGCVALASVDMEELYRVIPVGTVVEINP